MDIDGSLRFHLLNVPYMAMSKYVGEVLFYLVTVVLEHSALSFYSQDVAYMAVSKYIGEGIFYILRACQCSSIAAVAVGVPASESFHIHPEFIQAK